MLHKHACLRCGSSWIPRIEGLPTQCPRCKSPYWNKPKKEAKPITEPTYDDSTEEKPLVKVVPSTPWILCEKCQRVGERSNCTECQLANL